MQTGRPGEDRSRDWGPRSAWGCPEPPRAERCGTDSLGHRRAQARTRLDFRGWIFLWPKLPVRLQPLEMATDTFVLSLSPGLWSPQ